MKKIFSAIISSSLKGRLCGLLFALLATTTLWAYDFQSGNLYYNITSDTTVEVTYEYYRSGDNYAGLSIATIPETVTNGGITYNVASIGGYAFEDCSSLTSITIPNSVTSIGKWAFRYCSSLTSITIPNSVTSIGESAFYNTGIYKDESNWENDVLYIDNCLIEAKESISGAYTIKENTRLIAEGAFSWCTSLTSVTIPNSVTSIGDYAFSHCSSLTSVTIGNSVTSIGDHAFFECSSLTSITIPNSVTSIGNNAFCRCYSLTSVTIGNSVKSIGYNAFEDCSSLTKTNYIGNVASWCDIYFSTFRANPMCYSHNFYIHDQEIKDLVIPNTVTEIENYAFYGCSWLTSVTIPNSVTSIGESAFYGCSSLTSVTIPNSVTSIGENAFGACSSMTSVTINSDAIVNKNYSTASNISDKFGSQVTEYIIGDEVKGIGFFAFYGCPSLTSVTIPNSVTSIGENAFGACSSLTSVTINSDAIVSKNYSDDSNFYHIFGSQVTEYIIGDEVKGIGDWAFWNCNSLTSITIPNSVTSIGGHTFYGTGIYNDESNWVNDVLYTSNCLIEAKTKISGSYTIKDDTRLIVNGAFASCYYLTSITIPNSVTSIGYMAFVNCSALTTVICKAIEVPELGANVFKNMPLSEATLYVPAESLEDYKAAEQWKEFGKILPLEETPNTVNNISVPTTNTHKLLRDGQLLILRDGKTYNIMGAEVK